MDLQALMAVVVSKCSPLGAGRQFAHQGLQVVLRTWLAKAWDSQGRRPPQKTLVAATLAVIIIVVPASLESAPWLVRVKNLI